MLDVTTPAAGTTHVVSGTRPAVLRAIRAPAITLAIWTRPPPAGLVRIAESLARQAPFCATAEGRPGPAAAAVVDDLPGASACARTRLATDIARVSALFTAIAGSPTLRIRLEAIDGPGCHLFHADRVGLRLLCTYAGQGTEWVPDDAVDRAALGDNARAVTRPGAVRRLARFAVGLLKGEAFPGNAGRGIVHRSPPARPTPRLVLCLDEPGRF